MDVTKVVEKALDIGEAMLKTGAEVTRVEDTMRRICVAYIDGEIDVFSIVSLIILSVRSNDGQNITQTRRIYGYATDLNTLEQLNALSRYICEEHPGIDEIDGKMKNIMIRKKGFSIKNLLGSMIAASSFAIFFGGNVRDGLAALLVSICFCIFEYWFKDKSRNKVLYTCVCSFVLGCLSVLTVLCKIGMHVDMIIIGNIMLLIPGISFMNSVKDMLCGDTMTGMLRLLESVMIAVSIATGFAVSLMTVGRMFLV